jgi:hypothetical protein
MAISRPVRGDASEGQVTASVGLRDSLNALLRDGDNPASPEDIAGRVDLSTALGDVRRGAAAAEGLGYRYQSCVASLVASEALTIAARAVQRDEAAQTIALADAARCGRWVPLPGAQPAATNLCSAAATAVELTRDARLAVDVTSRGPAQQQDSGQSAPSVLERVTVRVRARATKPEPSIPSATETENLPGFTRPSAEAARNETPFEKPPARVALGDLWSRVGVLTEHPSSQARVDVSPKVQRRGPRL